MRRGVQYDAVPCGAQKAAGDGTGGIDMNWTTNPNIRAMVREGLR
jgi:hypothetical protein